MRNKVLLKICKRKKAIVMFGRRGILLILTKRMFHVNTCNSDIIHIYNIGRGKEFNVKRFVDFFPGKISVIILITLNPEFFWFCNYLYQHYFSYKILMFF